VFALALAGCFEGGELPSRPGSSASDAGRDATSTASEPPEAITTAAGQTSGGPLPASSSMGNGDQTETGSPNIRCDARPPRDITGNGELEVSSVFGGDPQFDERRLVDRNRATSWFSVGHDDDPEPSIQWTAEQSFCVSGVRITGNGMHANAAFRTDYGFDGVFVDLLRAGSVVATLGGAENLPGTPDPELTLEPGDGGIVIDALRVRPVGHEDTTDECGGFAELAILGAPLPP